MSGEWKDEDYVDVCEHRKTQFVAHQIGYEIVCLKCGKVTRENKELKAMQMRLEMIKAMYSVFVTGIAMVECLNSLKKLLDTWDDTEFRRMQGFRKLFEVIEAGGSQ